MPRALRPLWVAEQFEVAVFEGLTSRWTMARANRRRACLDARILDPRDWDDSAAQRLRKSIRQGRVSALLLLDIDNFATYNENHGRPGGDAVLHKVAEALAGELGKLDVIGRVGGDEFVILTAGARRRALRQDTEAFAERIRQAVESLSVTMTTPGQHPTIAGVSVTIGCSIMIDQRTSLNELQDAARTALHRGKRDGKNQARLMYTEARPSDP